jgi:hypothetical protein
MREWHLNSVDIRKEIFIPQIQGVTPSWPSCEGATAGGSAVARAHQPGRGGGADSVDGNGGGGGEARSGPVDGELRGGSPPPVRFCDGVVVAEHEW